MNTENINLLITTLRNGLKLAGRKTKFDMTTWLSVIPRKKKEKVCGTAACLAGHIQILKQKELLTSSLKEMKEVKVASEEWYEKNTPLMHIYYAYNKNIDEGTDWLGINSMQAANLFTPFHYRNKNNWNKSYEKDLPKAIRVLEHLRDTGAVDWAV